MAVFLETTTSHVFHFLQAMTFENMCLLRYRHALWKLNIENHSWNGFRVDHVFTFNSMVFQSGILNSKNCIKFTSMSTIKSNAFDFTKCIQY